MSKTADEIASNGATDTSDASRDRPIVDWFRNAFKRSEPQREVASDASANSQPPPEQPQEETSTGTEQTARAQAEAESSQPFKVFSTEDEFNQAVHRIAQSRADQIVAKKAKDELRDNDPHKYVELEKQEIAENDAVTAQNQQLETILGQLGQEYDKAVLSPLLSEVPDAVRSKIIGKGIQGFNGRTDAVKATLKAIRASAVDDAKEALRKDEAFIKQIMAEVREGESDFEYVGTPSVGSRRPSQSPSGQMNEIFRTGRR